MTLESCPNRPPTCHPAVQRQHAASQTWRAGTHHAVWILILDNLLPLGDLHTELTEDGISQIIRRQERESLHWHELIKTWRSLARSHKNGSQQSNFLSATLHTSGLYKLMRPRTSADELHLCRAVADQTFPHNQIPVLLKAPWRHSLLSATRTQGRLKTFLAAKTHDVDETADFLA